MTKDASGIRGLTVYEENPFLDVLTGQKSQKTEILYDGKQAVIHRETGEIQEEKLAVARIKWVEAEQFVKVYTANMSLFFDLSRPSQRVCEFVVHQMSQNSSINNDRLILYYDDYKEFCKEKSIGGTSANTFNRGLRELAGKALIAKGNRANLWFINPAVIFNGDRARFITEVRKRKKSNGEIMEEQGQIPLIPRD